MPEILAFGSFESRPFIQIRGPTIVGMDGKQNPAGVGKVGASHKIEKFERGFRDASTLPSSVHEEELQPYLFDHFRGAYNEETHDGSIAFDREWPNLEPAGAHESYR